MNILGEIKWFTAAVLYESIHEGEPIHIDVPYDSSVKTYEESHFLIKAASVEEASRLGEKLGIENEHTYKNQYGETVRWKFIKVLNCFELIEEELHSGTEIFSRYIVVEKEKSTQDVLKRFFQE